MTRIVNILNPNNYSIDTTVTEIIVILFEDGTIGRMQFFDTPTDENIQEHIEKGVWTSNPIDWHRYSNQPFPTLFRNAWVSDGKTVSIDMGKALEVKKDQLRTQREPLLKALDVNFMKAIEQNDTDTQTNIATQKQTLRDITAHPDLLGATTPEDLDSFDINNVINVPVTDTGTIIDSQIQIKPTKITLSANATLSAK